MTDDTQTFTDKERENACRAAAQAQDRLNRAFRALGYNGCHDAGRAYRNGDISGSDAEAIRALTDAYSYLDNGEVAMLHPEE